MGKILHAVQDFYSHSNWVDERCGEPIRTVDFINVASVRWRLPGNPLGKVLLSGTYPDGEADRNRVKGAPDHKVLNKDHDRSHGWVAQAGQVLSDSPNGRVVIDTGPHRGLTLHQLAVEHAVRSTADIYQEIAHRFTV